MRSMLLIRAHMQDVGLSADQMIRELKRERK